MQKNLNKINNINKDNNDLIKTLHKIIKIKEEELVIIRNELEKKINNLIDINENKINEIKNEENICVKFISIVQNINYDIYCDNNDIFAFVEEELYKKYPKYRETNNYFIFEGKQILRFKTIKQNKIKNGIPVTLVFLQDDKI